MNPTPFYRLVPKTPVENLRWRIRIRKAALGDKELQAIVRQACEDDICFFISAMCWLIEPRDEIKTIPFLLWEHQIDAVLTLVKSVQEATTEDPIDVFFDKSRGQGATWICLYIILWFWLKDPLFSAGIISRSIEAVDKKNYPGSLFPKLDWAISMLPYWMLPKEWNERKHRSQTDHVIFNPDTRGTVSGTACTAEAFSGDRLSVAMYDEAAKVKHEDLDEGMNSIQHVTNTRWVVSTHYGDSGPFYKAITQGAWKPVGEVKPFGKSGVYGNASGSFKVVLDWCDNPSHNRLLYRYDHGKFTAARPEDAEEVAKYIARIRKNGVWDKLVRRQFVKDGRYRSPWYDRKCLAESATPRGVAQDIDRDPRGTVGKCFSTELMDKMEKEQCRPPLWEGDVILRDGDLKLMEREGGSLRLWFKPGFDNLPPTGRYVTAADIAWGTGNEFAANSCLSGANAENGEQILEYVDGNIAPPKFARLCVAICEWLYDALFIWEAAGATGGAFKSEVMKQCCYWNVWMREKIDVRTREKTSQPGWVNNRIEHKRDLFQCLGIAMDEGEFVPRSKELITECGGWENKDPKTMAYTGTGHGDRAIAAGMLWLAMEDLRRISLDNSKEPDETDNGWNMAGRAARRAATSKRDHDDDLAGFRRQPSTADW